MAKVEKIHKLPCNLKAQGLSLNTIIIAALVLIVLVVLIVIFTGKMGSFVTNVESCDSKNGKLNAQPSLDGHACYKMAKTSSSNQYCCIPVSSDES